MILNKNKIQNNIKSSLPDFMPTFWSFLPWVLLGAAFKSPGQGFTLKTHQQNGAHLSSCLLAGNIYVFRFWLDTLTVSLWAQKQKNDGHNKGRQRASDLCMLVWKCKGKQGGPAWDLKRHFKNIHFAIHLYWYISRKNTVMHTVMLERKDIF